MKINIICLALKIQGNTLQNSTLQFIMRTCAYLKSFAICFNLEVIYLSFLFPSITKHTNTYLLKHVHTPEANLSAHLGLLLGPSLLQAFLLHIGILLTLRLPLSICLVFSCPTQPTTGKRSIYF